MQYLRVILVIAAAWGWMQSAHSAGLFGGPKTLSDDGTWSPSTFSKPSSGSCSVGCNSSAGYIQVDIRTKCMCISGEECFRIDTGMPKYMTSNGVGKMSAINGGGIYSTKPGPGSTSNFEFDGIDMGIKSNSAYGKWIHQSRNCTNGNPRTQGCIGVPCDKWPKVKALARSGKSVQVCGGVDYPTSVKCPGNGPCYKSVTPAQSAQDRAGLNVARPTKRSQNDGRQ